MDVVVLAGARNNGALRASSDCPYEAGIPVGGQTLLDYVIRPLAAVSEVERIVVVGPEESLTSASQALVWRIVPPGDSMVENLRRGLEALSSREKVLLATADIPLITAAAVEDFLARCRQRDAEVYYPIIAREPIESRYPGVKRTYATLREGTFTGGNLILL